MLMRNSLNNRKYKRLCPVCFVEYDNLEDHCKEIGDEVHLVLNVHTL